MMKALALSALALTGCDEILNGNDEVTVGSGSAPLRPLLAPGQLEATRSHGCYGNVCPIAAGGETIVPIRFNDGTDVLAMMDDARATLTVEREVVGGREYRVSTSELVGESTMLLLSNEHEPTEVMIETRPVRDVMLIPATRYEPQTPGPLAYPLSSREVVVRIEGPNLWEGGDPLVDATLVMRSAGSEQLSWDRFRLPSTVGTHAIDVLARSFGTRRFVVDVVDGIDRIESRVEGTPGIYKPMKICFYAYRGEQEVAVPFVIEQDAREWSDTNCVTNYSVDHAGTYSFTATALGISETTSFTVAR